MHTNKLKLFSVLMALPLLASCLAGTPVRTMEQPLPSYLANQPKPAWTAPLYGAEIRTAYTKGGDNKLFVTQRVTGTMQQWGLANDSVVLVDTAEGRTLWKQSRGELNTYINEVFAIPAGVVIAGTELKTGLPKLVALDTTSSAPLWSFTAPGYGSATRQVITSDSARIVQGNTESGQVHLWGVDTANGTQLWRREFKAARDSEGSPGFGLLAAGGTVVLVTDALVGLDPDTGRTLWQLDNAGIDASKLTIHNDAGKLVLNDRNRLLYLDAGQGTITHQVAAQRGEIVAPVRRDDKLFIVERDSQLLWIHRVEQQQGSVIWSSPTEGARSTVEFARERAFYSTSDQLVAIDLASGQTVARRPLPVFMHSDDGLADRLTSDANQVVVARENGVAAFDIDQGDLLFSHQIQHGLGYSYAYLDQKLKLRYLARSGGAWNAGATVSGISQANIDMQYSMQTGYNESTARAMGYDASGSSMVLARSTALLGATLSFSQSFRDMAVSENLEINRQQMTAAIRSQQASIQHGYYIRPFYYRGWGVTLVRLSDGKRVDLVHSRPVEPVRINHDTLPWFLVDPERNRLIVKGIGLNPGDSTYEKVGFGYNVYGSWPGIPKSWIIPNSSVMAFDLDRLPFAADSTLPAEKSHKAAGTLEISLREAIMSKDIEKVEALLRQGADVNAVDRFGMDALVYAGIADNKDIVELIIEHGADATFRDPHDWMAYHYTFMTHPINQSTGPIREANIKQGGITE